VRGKRAKNQQLRFEKRSSPSIWEDKLAELLTCADELAFEVVWPRNGFSNRKSGFNCVFCPLMSRRLRLFFICVSCMLLMIPAMQAQQSGSWNILQLKYHPNEQTEVFAEGQLRSLKFYQNFHYFEYKGGLSYLWRKTCRLTLGAGSYQTYREGGDFVLPKNNDEFRLWPQIQLTQLLGLCKVEQRYRWESRFTSGGYRNRYRYRFGFSVPLGFRWKEKQPFRLLAGNELFFTDREPYFERNRVNVALEARTGKNSSIQLGFLHQFDYKINDETGRSFFQLGYYLDFYPMKITPDRSTESHEQF
jgi:hypothetical protein